MRSGCRDARLIRLRRVEFDRPGSPSGIRVPPQFAGPRAAACQSPSAVSHTRWVAPRTTPPERMMVPPRTNSFRLCGENLTVTCCVFLRHVAENLRQRTKTIDLRICPAAAESNRRTAQLRLESIVALAPRSHLRSTDEIRFCRPAASAVVSTASDEVVSADAVIASADGSATTTLLDVTDLADIGLHRFAVGLKDSRRHRQRFGAGQLIAKGLRHCCHLVWRRSSNGWSGRGVSANSGAEDAEAPAPEKPRRSRCHPPACRCGDRSPALLAALWRSGF